MFLNINLLKRLMKKAYKTGLTVAQTDTRIYIAGSYWEMDILKEYMPKQILAQIIELTGEMPGIFERFTATKEGNQIEEHLRMDVDTEGFNKETSVTPLVLIGGGVAQRLLQSIEEPRPYIVNNMFIAIADNSAIDGERGETIVDRPYICSTKGILWKNNTTRFHAHFCTDDHHHRILEELSRCDLTEDPIN